MNFLVDSNSLGLAHGTAQLYWLCPGATRGWLGSPSMIAWARRSWTCYSSSLCGRPGLPVTSRLTTSMAWSPSSSTTPIAWLTSPSFGRRGEPGNPRSEDGGTRRWCPSRLTWWRGEHHEPGQCGHYGAGLVPWRLGRNPCLHARPVDFRHLSSVSGASLPFAVPVHPPSVQDVTPSCIETQLRHLRPSDIVLLPGDTEVSSAVSGPARTLQTLAAVVSGVAMAYHPGAYAVQAAGEAPPCAETAMERVASTRVEQWRSQWGLHDDTDFAYAFASYDSAVAHGGHHVADAWLQARSKTIDEDLIPQAAAVAESSGSTDRPPTWPAPKASMLKRSKMVQALRLRPAPDQPEQVLLRAAALRKAFSQAKVMRPQGELTPERFAQWQDALDTLAKRKVTEAEGATVVNALKSWAELRTYMEEKDRLFPPDALDLYGFLQNGTAGPYRAYHSLKWFSKHGRLQWDFTDVPVPARKNPPKQARPEQAVAVEPPMVAALEEKIQSLYEAGDPRWRGLLSSWLVAFGVLRYQHIMRSRPVKVTPCSFHGYCPKGKQKANRGGFSFSIPATFVNGWAWGSALFRDYSSLDKAKQATSGLGFDAEGTAYTLKYVNELNREVFEHLVQNTEDLSSYSWRRAAPTLGTLLKLSPLELCSLGDWADKSQIPKEATMPMHYSAARYESSLRTKHLVRLAMEKLLTHESWETIPTETYAEALEYARQNVDKTLKQESRVIWAAPLTKTEMQARFQLSEALKLKAAAKREEAQAKGDLPDMPASLNGKVLSKFMKNGAPICGAYQTRTCHLEKEDCPGRHACAILRQSGRVCGGGHPASECYDKKFIKVEDMPGEGSGSGSAKAKPTSKSKEERPPEPATPPKASVRRPRSPTGPPPKATPAKKAKAAPVPKPAPLPALASSSEDEEIEVEEEDLPIPEALDTRGPDQKFDRLATVRGKTAESPSLIYQNRAGGKLWLSGIPTRGTAHRFPKGVTLQIACMAEAPSSRGGVVLTDALLKHLCVAHAGSRTRDFEEVWPLLRNTMYAGESALIHCLSGRHRAGIGGCVFRALLAQESWDVAVAYVKSCRRSLDIPGIIHEEGMQSWVDTAIRTSSLRNPFPEPCGYIATTRSKVHLELNNGQTLCSHKQSAERAVRLVKPMTTQDLREAMAWGRAFCDGCLVRAAASWHPR